MNDQVEFTLRGNLQKVVVQNEHLKRALEYLAKEAGYDVTYLQTGEVGLSTRDGVGAIVL
jgi:hypothetical protein